MSPSEPADCVSECSERDPVAEMARTWYGYGPEHWKAPYWFIGPEPGMAGDGTDTLERRAETWRTLGGGELVDCREHHLALGFDRWHRADAAIQPTWGKLIRLLLAFKAQPVSAQAIREYQRDEWGMRAGETCVVELCSMAANRLSTPSQRHVHREERISVLRNKLREHHQPTFVVMYGIGARAEWERIAGGAFPEDGMLSVGRTAVLMTPHPVAHGLTNQDWQDFGHRLRERCASLRGRGCSAAAQ